MIKEESRLYNILKRIPQTKQWKNEGQKREQNRKAAQEW